MSTESNIGRVAVVTGAAVTTELVNHITHGETREATAQFYEATAITADDVARIIAFAVSRPRSVSLNEISSDPPRNPSDVPEDVDDDGTTLLPSPHTLRVGDELVLRTSSPCRP